MNDELNVNAYLQKAIEERLKNGLFISVRLSGGKFIIEIEYYKDDDSEPSFTASYGWGISSLYELNLVYTKILAILGEIGPRQLEEVIDLHFKTRGNG